MKLTRNVRWDKNSIIFKLTVFVIFLIVAQSALLIATMVAAGVLEKAKEDAFQSFYEKAGNRKAYIEREMNNRWTNVGPYLEQLSKTLPLTRDARSTEQFLEESAPTLISMLRTTMTNGAFILLNDKLDDPDQRTGLYLRDYDPLLNDENHKDLYFIAGPFEIAQHLNIPMDQNWSYNLKLTKENRSFYDTPYSNAPLSMISKLLGYWSRPFHLTTNDLPIITYSMPIFDRNNELRGIIGVEISVDYFNQFLPAADLQPRDSLGYLIGYKGPTDTSIHPLITNGALQKRMIPTDEDLILIPENEKKDIYLLKNHNSQDNIYASVQRMGLYNHNTPFENEEWYLIGFMQENRLLSFMNKIQDILVFSFFGSIVLGGIGGYLISFVFTKPIIHLAKQVGETDPGKDQLLVRTGLTEIDDLSRAIETANKNLLESTLKLSQIIDLVDVPIGAFEYQEKEGTVFATDQLKQVLLFEDSEAKELYSDKTAFINRLHQLMARKEPEEENVYKISDSPEKWIKIKMLMNEDTTLGVVIDVTDDIHEKNKIKVERDYDLLTKIYNRRAYERNVSRLLKEGELKVSALVMLDLDFLKQINDTFGHLWGDYYIASTAEFLSEFRKGGCIIGRLSGDEFSVFLYGFDSKDQIRELVEQFYQRLDTQPISFPGGERKITISAGLFWLNDHAGAKHTFEEISQKADQALYEAKNNAKGSCREFT